MKFTGAISAPKAPQPQQPTDAAAPAPGPGAGKPIDASSAEAPTTAPACYQMNDGRKNEKIQQKMSERDLDSGYAWLILLVMFLLQSSISGASRVYGIVYAREVAIGYYDREQASWPIATASAVENLAGILTPALAQFLSWRQMELMSTSLFITANALAYYSQSLTLDIVALGLVQGLALSTCTVLSLVINNDYFERYRTTAYGIQMSGSTFGVLYLSPLVTWILETHEGPTNFRLVYLALAGVFCVNLVLVLFIRPRRQVCPDRHRRHRRHHHHLHHRQVDAKTHHQQLNQDLDRATTAGLGSGFGASASRKVSRFESHFERKSSIASVSYRARSRRQSILSRVAAPGPGAAAPVAPPSEHTATLESQLTHHLAKSISGIELARANSARAHELTAGAHESLGKRISSSCSMRHSDPAAHQQRPSVVSQLDPSEVAPVSRQGSLSKCPRQPVRKLTGRSTFYLDADDASLASCNIDRSALVELDLSLFKKLALDIGEPEQATTPRREFDGKTGKANKQDDDDDDEEEEEEEEEEEQKFSLQLVKSLLALPYLHCTWIMLALYYLIARILVIILVDFAHDHGHSLADSTDLLNYWSLGELIGRVLLGSLIDLKFLSCKSCIALTCTLIGALLTLMVLVQSYLIYATCSLLIAALISLEYMLINVMMVEYLGKHRVTSCYSLAACLSSAVLFARPSMIGLFRDQLGTYDGLLLLLAGLALTFALLFYLLEPLLVRRWPKCVRA